MRASGGQTGASSGVASGAFTRRGEHPHPTVAQIPKP